MGPMVTYFPALTGKAGELTALGHTPSSEREVIIPIVTLPVADDFDEQEVSAEIAKMTSKIGTNWDSSHRMIIDANGSDGVSISGQPSVGVLHDALRAKGIKAEPVIYLSSSNAYMSSVSAIAATDGSGVCIRLSADDVTAHSSLATDLDAALSSVGVAPSDVDLVLDLGFVETGSVSAFAALVPLIIPTLPHVNKWRNLVLLSGAFPENLGSLTPYVPGAFARHDAELWRRVSGLTSTIRELGFGDYATSHPVAATVSGPWRSAPNIRYTEALTWIALKSNMDRIRGNHTFFDICSQLLKATPSPLQPPSFSWGDGEFHRCASGTGGPGNGTTWKAWSTSHHISTVVDRLATTGAP